MFVNISHQNSSRVIPEKVEIQNLNSILYSPGGRMSQFLSFKSSPAPPWSFLQAPPQWWGVALTADCQYSQQRPPATPAPLLSPLHTLRHIRVDYFIIYLLSSLNCPIGWTFINWRLIKENWSFHFRYDCDRADEKCTLHSSPSSDRV